MKRSQARSSASSFRAQTASRSMRRSPLRARPAAASRSRSTAGPAAPGTSSTLMYMGLRQQRLLG